MYVKYQTVRNTFLSATAAVLAAFGFVISREPHDTPVPPRALPDVTSKSDSSTRPRPPEANPPVASTPKTPTRNDLHKAAASVPAETASLVAEIESSDIPWAKTDVPNSNSKPADRSELYRGAMRIVESSVPSGGKGKDVLGPSSPWKLNLYDDDNDGHWDRGKLDTDRDDIDDEDWTFKKGRWEKESGREIWDGSDWIADAATPKSDSVGRTAATADPNLARYRHAMQLAAKRAAPDGKGKDVLGPSSPWKLNLYDDDKDGQWDRGKLDYNRDEVDDEKWNFKDGRWEKDGGQTIWSGSAWIPSGK